MHVRIVVDYQAHTIHTIYLNFFRTSQRTTVTKSLHPHGRSTIDFANLNNFSNPDVFINVPFHADSTIPTCSLLSLHFFDCHTVLSLPARQDRVVKTGRAHVQHLQNVAAEDPEAYVTWRYAVHTPNAHVTALRPLDACVDTVGGPDDAVFTGRLLVHADALDGPTVGLSSTLKAANRLGAGANLLHCSSALHVAAVTRLKTAVLVAAPDFGKTRGEVEARVVVAILELDQSKTLLTGHQARAGTREQAAERVITGCTAQGGRPRVFEFLLPSILLLPGIFKFDFAGGWRTAGHNCVYKPFSVLQIGRAHV